MADAAATVQRGIQTLKQMMLALDTVSFANLTCDCSEPGDSSEGTADRAVAWYMECSDRPCSFCGCPRWRNWLTDLSLTVLPAALSDAMFRLFGKAAAVVPRMRELVERPAVPDSSATSTPPTAPALQPNDISQADDFLKLTVDVLEVLWMSCGLRLVHQLQVLARQSRSKAQTTLHKLLAHAQEQSRNFVPPGPAVVTEPNVVTPAVSATPIDPRAALMLAISKRRSVRGQICVLLSILFGCSVKYPPRVTKLTRPARRPLRRSLVELPASAQGRCKIPEQHCCPPLKEDQIESLFKSMLCESNCRCFLVRLPHVGQADNKEFAGSACSGRRPNVPTIRTTPTVVPQPATMQ